MHQVGGVALVPDDANGKVYPDEEERCPDRNADGSSVHYTAHPPRYQLIRETRAKQKGAGDNEIERRPRGALEWTAMSPKNSRPHDINRCRKCKVALWSDYGRRPALRFLRVSTIDRPHGIKPKAHIFTRSKVSWVRIPKGVPSFKVYYDIKKLWPAKSLKRREAILGLGR